MVGKIINQLGKLSSWEWLIIILAALTYLFIGYFIPRSNFISLFSAVAIAFLVMLFFVRQNNINRSKLRILVVISLVFRLLFLLATPNLSDDYKRFLWDGELIHQGINPYDYKPTEVRLPQEEFNSDWQNLVISKDYYSVYPPMMQLSFYLAASFSKDFFRIIALRILLILMEVLSIYLLMRLLSLFQISTQRVLLYALNPLPIIEFAGNLHFEAGMICFTLLAVFLFIKNRNIGSGLALSGAFLFKLFPIIFIPAFLKRPFNKRQVVFLFSFIIPSVVAIFFIGTPGIQNLYKSLQLYFYTFEFNASIYYLVRWLGFKIEGYNIIQQAAPYFTLIVAIIILSLTAYQIFRHFRTPFHFFTLALTVYFLFATTVNPWYITPILAFGVFTRWTFPVIWSLLVLLSYHAYSGEIVSENTWLLFLEYGVLLLVMAIDVFNYQNSTHG